MARKPNSTPRKTTRQHHNNGSQAKQMPRKAAPHASQDKNARKRKGSQAKKDSSPWLTSQQCMPRKAKRFANAMACKPKQGLARPGSPNSIAQKQKKKKQKKKKKHASQGHPARKPNKSHLHGSQPTNSTVVLKHVLKVFSVILNKQGVLGIPVCILPRPIPKPNDLCRSSPNATPLSDVPKLFPCPPLPRFPGSCPILALSPSRLFPGSWLLRTSRPFVTFGGWCGLRRVARGWRRAVEVEEGGRRCGSRRAAQEGRRTVDDAAYGCPARVISMPASHQYQCPPMSQDTHAEGQQGAVGIGKMVCLSTTRALSEGFVLIYAGLRRGKGIDVLTIETGVVTVAWRSNGHSRNRGWLKTRLTVTQRALFR